MPPSSFRLTLSMLFLFARGGQGLRIIPLAYGSVMAPRAASDIAMSSNVRSWSRATTVGRTNLALASVGCRLRFASLPSLRRVHSQSFRTANVVMSYSDLVVVSKDACDLISPMVRRLYSAMNSETSKMKADASVFTIADGLVQHLLDKHLFGGDKFANVVGEEESNVNLVSYPYTVDDLSVPEEFNGIIEKTLREVKALASRIEPERFRDVTVFIDPIDGTREFASGLGEQCSICIGFADSSGRPIAGLVYRPIPDPASFAGGCAREGFVIGELDNAAELKRNGFLTSNGSISKFIQRLIDELGYVRVPSGGAGNKMLMLLEGKGAAYIQDRGVSRWDTAGAQAVIEAYGGALSKLTSFERDRSLQSYTYLQSETNLDFEPGVASLTKFNCNDVARSRLSDGKPILATSVDTVKSYANLCGLLALDKSCLGQQQAIYEAIQRARTAAPPSYD